MSLPGQTREINFIGARYAAAVLSAALLVVSSWALATKGLNFGIDFTGGVLLEAEYDGPADLEDIRSRLADNGFPDAQVQNFGTAADVLIRILPREDVENSALGEQIFEVLRAGGLSVDRRRVEFVGPQVGEELAERGGLAIIFALLMILAYIMARFQWKFAVGAVGALVHDVIISVGFFALFQIPFDLAVLAAMLAVIGYSLNDTIVVFDRIRENFKAVRQETPEAMVNTSVNQMLGRTVITSFTTLLVLLALLFMGGEAVRGFSIALIVGIVVGTYSSVFIASAAALALNVTPVDLMPPKVEDDELRDQP